MRDFFDCEFRGRVAAKHKGEIDMYFVKGIREDLSVNGEGKAPSDEFRKVYDGLGVNGTHLTQRTYSPAGSP